MTIETKCPDRRALETHLSRHLQTPAVYLRMPSCAYRIGPITVNQDGSITGDHTDLMRILPFLREHGYVSAEVQPDPPADLKAQEVCCSLDGWTMPQIMNLMKLLCSKQHLIRRMLKSDALHIDSEYLKDLAGNPPIDADELEAAFHAAIGTGALHGFLLSHGEMIFELEGHIPQDIAETFFTHIVQLAKALRHVQLTERRFENEKYDAHAFLTRLSLSGVRHKTLRRMLTGHLTGYAAYKTETGMQGHKERQIARRQHLKAEVSDE